MEQKLSAGPIHYHRHQAAYGALVLEGSYLEHGISGRWKVEPGDILVHHAFEGHGNVIAARGAAVLNFEIDAGNIPSVVLHVDDPDEIIYAARNDGDLGPLLLDGRPQLPLSADWQDLLASELRGGPVQLGLWARRMNLAPATLSRGFKAAFGTTPAKYRMEAQSTEAMRQLRAGSSRIADIAYRCGFSDQAHLSRAIRHLTGRSPRSWLNVKTVQDDR